MRAPDRTGSRWPDLRNRKSAWAGGVGLLLLGLLLAVTAHPAMLSAGPVSGAATPVGLLVPIAG